MKTVSRLHCLGVRCCWPLGPVTMRATTSSCRQPAVIRCGRGLLEELEDRIPQLTERERADEALLARHSCVRCIPIGNHQATGAGQAAAKRLAEALA